MCKQFLCFPIFLFVSLYVASEYISLVSHFGTACQVAKELQRHCDHNSSLLLQSIFILSQQCLISTTHLLVFFVMKYNSETLWGQLCKAKCVAFHKLFLEHLR